MRRRPPRSTRTDTLFPYTTLFRSNAGLDDRRPGGRALLHGRRDETVEPGSQRPVDGVPLAFGRFVRSEEHTSELQSLMRISYAVFCLKKKNNRRVREARL